MKKDFVPEQKGSIERFTGREIGCWVQDVLSDAIWHALEAQVRGCCRIADGLYMVHMPRDLDDSLTYLAQHSPKHCSIS